MIEIERPLTVKKLRKILKYFADNSEIFLDVDYANTDGFYITAVIEHEGYVEFVTDAVLK